MSNLEQLLILDLSSYGVALSIINQFCDDKDVRVFEVSPIGTVALLVLLVKEKTLAAILKNEIFSFYKNSVLSMRLIENFDPQILMVYLSQNKAEVLKNILVQEFSFVSEAFAAAQLLLEKKISLIDFRVVRTYPLNAILISTSAEIESLIQIKSQVSGKTQTLIEKTEPTLKAYFQNP